MVEIPNTLFSETKRKELSANEKIVKKQRDAIQKWKDNLDSEILDVESQYKDHLRDLMINALGYPLDKIKAETGEKNTRLDYSYTPDSGTGGVLFELKSRKKKPFQHQGYDKKEQDTPVDQAITYIEKNSHISYAVITNFEEFVLITREDLRSQCYHFKFPPKGMKLLPSEIKEFVHFFSKDGIENGFIETAKRATIIEEDTITTDFYKLYHQTRLMLIHAFNDKKRIEYDDAINITQTYLNRLIFLFFAEDNNLIKKRVFTDGILSILNFDAIKEKTISISGYIQTLFSWMDEGSDEIDNKSGFNGEFFKEQMDANAFFYDLQTQEFFKEITKKVQVPTRIKLNKENQIAIDRYEGKINPIIINFLKMASYNFRHKDQNAMKEKDIDDSDEQISVNILGHIFEQSIGDLEELQTKEKSKRKKEGVFYTPDYITSHICKNTIIPYLSKNEATEPHQLVMEYKDDIQELEDKIDQIKILDPACGSGAFLVKAVDILIEIIDEIQNFKYEQGLYTISKKGKKESGVVKQLTFDKEHETDKKRRELIQNNIYGVDINSESIEITKLSLFLKIATKNKRLIGLSQRIMWGNSLIDDKKVDKKAFDWKTEFAEILHDDIPNKGFDIIIGNPPYIKNQYLDYNHTDWFKKHKKTAYGRIDASGIFIELAKTLLKKNGIMSYIISNQFLIAEYGRKTRKFLLEKFKILQIIDFADLRVFVDASTYVGIFILKNSEPSNFNYLRILKDDLGKEIDLSQNVTIDLNSLNEEPWILENQKLVAKLGKNKRLNEIGGYVAGIVTGNDDVLLFDNKKLEKMNLEKEIIHPILEGTDPDRYMPIKPHLFVIYPYKLQNGKTTLVDEKEISKKYPLAYEYLKANKKKLDTRKDSREKFGGPRWYGLVRFGLLENYNRERIVSSGEVKEHVFTLDKTKSSHLYARVVSIKIDDESYDIHYVLGLLNSKVVRFYYQHSAPKKQGGYFSLTSSFVNNIPLPLANETLQNKIISNVKEILSLKKSFEEQCAELLELFEINYNIKINSKIKKFYELEFSELMREFSKQKFKPSLEIQAKIRKYFNSIKDRTNELQKQVKLKEDKIDEFVYDIYDLNKAEIDEIQEFLER